MSAITFDKLIIDGDILINNIEDIEIDIKANSHGKMKIKGMISKEEAEKIIVSQYKNKEIKLLQKDDDGVICSRPIFSGLINNLEVKENAGVYTAIIYVYSGTYILDMEKKKRSFQDRNMSYKEVIEEVLKDTSNACSIYVEGKNEKINKPIIQYLESDWEFIVRMASHLGAVVIPETTFSFPRFWFGFPKNLGNVKLDQDSYKTGIHVNYFKHGGLSNPIPKSEYLYYKVDSDENYEVGCTVNFLGKSMRICEKHSKINKGILNFSYILGNKGLMMSKKKYNTKFNGMSLLGTVLSTSGEKVKVHLDIDDEQNKDTAYDYPFTPPTGNLMYCMPKVGTRVSLTMYDTDEQNAKIINCIRTNGGACTDTTKRSLSSEFGKKMYLNPNNLGFSCDKSESGGDEDTAPNKINIDDSKGINLDSNKEIFIMSKDKLKFVAPKVNVESPSNISLFQTGSPIVNENAFSNPQSFLSLSGEINQTGKSLNVKAEDKVTFEPFNDAPKEGKFDWGQFGLNILAGLAAVAVTVVAISFAPVSAAVLIGAGIAGTMAVGFMAYSNYKDGNVDSAFDYVVNGITSTIGGAVCMLLGPAGSMSFLGYIAQGAFSGIAGNLAGTTLQDMIYSLAGDSDKITGLDYLISGITGGLAGGGASALTYWFNSLANLAARQAAKEGGDEAFKKYANQVARDAGLKKATKQYIGKLLGLSDKTINRLSLRQLLQRAKNNPSIFKYNTSRNYYNQYIDVVKDNAIATELSGNGGNIYDVLFGNEGNVEEILDDSLEDYITGW